jgi:hypothetical protein
LGQRLASSTSPGYGFSVSGVIASEIQSIFGENLPAPQYFPLILVEQG